MVLPAPLTLNAMVMEVEVEVLVEGGPFPHDLANLVDATFHHLRNPDK